LTDDEDNEVDLTAANTAKRKMTDRNDGDDDEAYVDDEDNNNQENSIW